MQCCPFISTDLTLGAGSQPCSRGTARRGPTRAIPSCSASEASMWHHQERTSGTALQGRLHSPAWFTKDGDCPMCHTGWEQENRQKNMPSKVLTMRRRFLLILAMIFFLKNWVKSTPCMNGRMFKDTDDAEKCCWFCKASMAMNKAITSTAEWSVKAEIHKIQLTFIYSSSCLSSLFSKFTK